MAHDQRILDSFLTPIPCHGTTVAMANLPERLRELRTNRGLTHEALAFAAGISVASVQRTEAGKHTPSLRTLTALAAALGVPVADFFPAPIPAASSSGEAR
jgi:transcriptional regulator with XRE-family HTH domain